MGAVVGSFWDILRSVIRLSCEKLFMAFSRSRNASSIFFRQAYSTVILAVPTFTTDETERTSL